MIKIYPFNLDFKNERNGSPYFASFQFIFEDRPIEGISCCYSSRYAGDMKNIPNNKNRLDLFNELGLNPANVYGLKQIHSRSVLAVDSSNPPSVDADGMTAKDCGIALSITAADCLSVFLFDVKTGAFALVHSGWKGTGIAVDAVNLMQNLYKTNSFDLAAVLGPCIGSCCYNVDEQRAHFFEKNFGAQNVQKTDGNFFIDLKGANIKLLQDIGVKNIALCNDCTFCDDRFGSFRREGADLTHALALLY